MKLIREIFTWIKKSKLCKTMIAHIYIDMNLESFQGRKCKPEIISNKCYKMYETMSIVIKAYTCGFVNGCPVH